MQIGPIVVARPNRVRSRSDTVAHGARGEFRAMQIGPRIRVRGTLGKIGQQAKIGLGQIASNPIVTGATGAFFGPGAAALLGGVGHALDTSHGSVGLGDIAKGSAIGYGTGQLGSALKTGASALLKGGATQAVNSLNNPRLDANGMPVDEGPAGGGGGFLDKLKGALTGALTGGGGGLGGALGSIGGFLSNNKDNLLMGGALAASIADANRARGLQEKGLNYATDAYDQRAPLRAQAMSALQNPQQTNLASTFATRGNNPYAATGRIGTKVRLPGFSMGGV